VIDIIPMKADHVGQVAQLHLKSLQTRFSGRAGIELLKLYYETVTKEIGGCGYVAICQSEVMGFVCGIWDVRKLRNKLFLDHLFLFAVWGVIQVLGQPKVIVDFLARFKSSYFKAGLSNDNHCIYYELRPIVVSPAIRRAGLGQQLVKRLISDARLRGYESIHLYTELDNEVASNFYKNVGFKEVGRPIRGSGQYILFELKISQAFIS